MRSDANRETASRGRVNAGRDRRGKSSSWVIAAESPRPWCCLACCAVVSPLVVWLNDVSRACKVGIKWRISPLLDRVTLVYRTTSISGLARLHHPATIFALTSARACCNADLCTSGALLTCIGMHTNYFGGHMDCVRLLLWYDRMQEHECARSRSIFHLYPMIGDTATHRNFLGARDAPGHRLYRALDAIRTLTLIVP